YFFEVANHHDRAFVHPEMVISSFEGGYHTKQRMNDVFSSVNHHALPVNRSWVVAVFVDSGSGSENVNEVTKELGNDAQAVGFVPVNGLVVGSKGLVETVVPHPIELAKALANQSVVARDTMSALKMKQ
ncbi:3039_t:CDS:2, partial [Acaulospora colombiana]